MARAPFAGLALLALGAAGASALSLPDAPAQTAAAAPASAAGGTAVASPVRLVRIGRFRAPTYVTAPPRDRSRLFVVERAGRIRVVRNGRKLRRAFLDIRGRVRTGGESGLLSMAFPPDYARSRRFYVYYVDNGGAIRVEAYRRSRVSADRALRHRRRTVIRQRHRRFNHKGGQVQVGPDGKLYVAFGDGGGSGDPDRNAQNRRRLLGKVLRLDPRPGRRRGYRIPRSNPFARPGGARGEIYAYGLRNPFRFSFDRRRGHLAIGDVGQDAVEEIDVVRNRRGRRRTPRGGYNFGWSVFEGRRRFRSGRARRHVPPVIQRTHALGSCSIVGGYFIRDRALGRRLYGRYLYGDLCDARLRTAAIRPGRAVGDRALGLRVRTLVSFGEDARGRLYAVSLGGPVYRLARRR